MMYYMQGDNRNDNQLVAKKVIPNLLRLLSLALPPLIMFEFEFEFESQYRITIYSVFCHL